jgi:hypothetical protein
MKAALTPLIATTLALAGCNTTASLNTQTGEIKGLDSHDVANIVTNRDYVDGKIKAPQKALVSFKANPGQAITINAAEFTVWQPTGPQDDIKAPPQAKSAFERNTKALGGLIKDATPALAIGAALSDRNNTRRSNELIAEMDNEAERAQADAQAVQTSELVDALREKPQFFVLPAGSATTE